MSHFLLLASILGNIFQKIEVRFFEIYSSEKE